LRKVGIRNGIEITTIADIPSRGTGLGSSSAIAVGLLNALYAFKGYRASPKKLAEEACEMAGVKNPDRVVKMNPDYMRHANFTNLRGDESKIGARMDAKDQILTACQDKGRSRPQTGCGRIGAEEEMIPVPCLDLPEPPAASIKKSSTLRSIDYIESTIESGFPRLLCHHFHFRCRLEYKSWNNESKPLQHA
jgi:hypothetical protein